jgi:hypothetical protein
MLSIVRCIVLLYSIYNKKIINTSIKYEKLHNDYRGNLHYEKSRIKGHNPGSFNISPRPYLLIEFINATYVTTKTKYC